MRLGIAVLFLGFLSGCASIEPVSNEQNTWIQRKNGLPFGIHVADMYYCVANKSDKSAKPVCYEAEKVSAEEPEAPQVRPAPAATPSPAPAPKMHIRNPQPNPVYHSNDY